MLADFKYLSDKNVIYIMYTAVITVGTDIASSGDNSCVDYDTNMW